MSVNQKTLIKKYFWSLVEEFITDPAHKNNIKVIFKNHIESDSSGDTLGLTKWKMEPGQWHWQVDSITKVEVPGSRWKEPDEHTYKVYFLNHYQGERWRGTVAHEFAHLWLYSTMGNHEHDDLFYSQMDLFEDWLDKKWNLSPRQDKEGDWNQHTDRSKREQRKYSLPQLHNNNSPALTLNKEEMAEYNRLLGLLNGSQTLTELEQNYQTAKTSPVYSSDKKKTSNWWKTAKVELDDCYNDKKNFHKLVDLMKNAKTLSQLKQIYQTARNSSLRAGNKSTLDLDKEYISLKNNLPTSDNFPKENQPNNPPWKPLLIGGGAVVSVCLILVIFSLLIPTRRKKQFPNSKIY